MRYCPGAIQLGRLKYHHPFAAMDVSTAHLPVPVFKPSSATLNHESPVCDEDAAFDT
jgi:hypothetical protein